MRKNAKTDFAKELKATVEKLSTETLKNNMDVIDGGRPLHSVIWPPSCTYMVVYISLMSSTNMNLIMSCALMGTLN